MVDNSQKKKGQNAKSKDHEDEPLSVEDANQKVQEDQMEQENLEEDPLTRCQMERDDYKERYIRALADYRNFEQRAQNEKNEIRVRSEMLILEQLLPFLDNLKRAEVFIQDQGLQMIKKDLERVLEELGVKELELIGKPFDPAVAEVIEVVEGQKDNIITDVILSAYTYKDKVLRHGQVKVAKST
jgi:molecular chaperone GrpE